MHVPSSNFINKKKLYDKCVYEVPSAVSKCICIKQIMWQRAEKTGILLKKTVSTNAQTDNRNSQTSKLD
jgi:hypothetical protein